MTLRTRLSDDMKTAMRAKDERGLATVRLILAALKDKDIAARPGGNTTGIDDASIMQMMNGMIKQRRDSIALYQQGNRPELAAKEEAEIALLIGYLPEQMSEDELKKIVAETMAELPDKNVGNAMKAVMAKVKGKADGALVSKLVKDALN